MKKFLKIIIPVLFLTLCFNETYAQNKTTRTKKTSKKSVTKIIPFTPREFGSQTSVSQVTDIDATSPAFESVQHLIENSGVTIAYNDNTFKGKEPLRRGDFIVALNSAFVNIRSVLDAGGIDSSLINTYDRNRNGSYLTTIDQVKDVPSTSYYYPAAKSLLEKWGVGAPFTLAKTLNPGAVMTEKEVYDILKATLGYSSSGANPYSTGITREKFAVVLNNAISQKMTVVNTMLTEKRLTGDEERRQQAMILQQADNARKDSVSKEIQMRKAQAAKQEAEARQKLSERKRIQLEKKDR